MPMPISAISRAILEEILDGEWHGRWDIFAKVSHRIPAGMAMSRHDRHRRMQWLRRVRHQDSSVTVEDAPDAKHSREERISLGRRFVFQRIIYNLEKVGYIENDQPANLSTRQYAPDWKIRITPKGVTRLTLAKG